jgi:hypothetical protein
MVAASSLAAATPLAGMSVSSSPPQADLEAYTYRDLIGPLNASPTVWAECVFVDPRR